MADEKVLSEVGQGFGGNGKTGRFITGSAMFLASIAAWWLALPSMAVNAWSIEGAKQVVGRGSDLAALKRAPNGHQGAWRWKARVALDRNNTDMAIEVIDSLERTPISPYDQHQLLFLGDLLRREGNWDKAMCAYRLAAQIADGKLTWQARVLLGQALYFQGQGIRVAVAEVERGIALAPDKSEGYGIMADLLRAEKRYPEAELWYEQAVAKDPSNIWLVARRIDNLLDSGQHDRALELLADSVRRFPTEPHFYYQQDMVYERQGHLETAVNMARQAVLLDGSKSAGYHVALGKLLYKSGYDVETVAAQFRQAIEVEPQNATGYAELGRLYQMQSRYSEAETWYGLAVERAPNDPWVWTMRGENALQASKTSEAIQFLSETTSRFSSFAHAYFLLALAYQAAGDSERAVSNIEESVTLAPTASASYWITAGQIYERAGNWQKAIEAYEAALSLEAGNKAAEQAISRLKAAQSGR